MKSCQFAQRSASQSISVNLKRCKSPADSYIISTVQLSCCLCILASQLSLHPLYVSVSVMLWGADLKHSLMAVQRVSLPNRCGKLQCIDWQGSNTKKCSLMPSALWIYGLTSAALLYECVWDLENSKINNTKLLHSLSISLFVFPVNGQMFEWEN